MVRIVSDSTGDFSKELQERYDIKILPLHIVLGEEEFRDGIEITDTEIFKWADENKTTPKTSAVSPSDAYDLLKPMVEAGDEVVVYTISSSMSTTNNVIKMAAEDLHAEDRVFVINSWSLSMGIALLAIEGAIMAKNGATGAQIAERMDELKKQVKASFVVDTLTYLHRGGRCSSVAALAGSALKLHPKIVLREGAMYPDKKYRGKMDAVIMSYITDLEEELMHAKTDRVALVNAKCAPEIVSAVRDYLKGLGRFEEIIEGNAGGVICSHCGPGTLGVMFISE